MTTTDDRESLPRCCDATIAIVQRTQRAAACPVCGDAYGPTDRPALTPAAPRDPVAHHQATLPGAAPDARVQVATDEHLRPSSTPPVARLTHVDADELVRARRLLTELRPDRGGPLGWAADGAPPAASGSAWTPALRVQTSEVPAILPGSFASTAPASLAPDLDRGFPGMPDDTRATLRWCQRSGTLAQGLRALYTSAALSLADELRLAVWAAMPAVVRAGARPAWGRRQVLAAADAWWGEGVDTAPLPVSNAAIGTPLAAVDPRPPPADAIDAAQSAMPDHHPS